MVLRAAVDSLTARQPERQAGPGADSASAGSGRGSGTRCGCFPIRIRIRIRMQFRIRMRFRIRFRSRNADAARQIRRAADSVANNIEGRKRLGRDRVHHWSVATGSAEEVRTALRVAVAWGDLGESEVREALEILDRLAATGWRLTH